MDLTLKNGFRVADNSGFNYSCQGNIEAGETVIIPLPNVSANKRGVNDIGWQIDGDAEIYATIAKKPKEENTPWQKIEDYEDINKCASAIKIVGGAGTSAIYLRIILN